MNYNPDNPMALPLTRAEEIRLWGDESAAAAAEQRTRDVLLLDKDAITELEIFEYQVESDALNRALAVAASYRSTDKQVADAMRRLVAAIVARCDADYWEIVDENRRASDYWKFVNGAAGAICGIPARREERED